MEIFNNILVVSRSFHNCAEVLRIGISSVRKYDQKLRLLHVIYDPYFFNDWNVSIVSYDKKFQIEVKKVRDDLDHMIVTERSEELDIFEWIEYGSPQKHIEIKVNKAGIDLILLSAHKEMDVRDFLSSDASIKMQSTIH
jgi:hypothetical protein